MGYAGGYFYFTIVKRFGAVVAIFVACTRKALTRTYTYLLLPPFLFIWITNYLLIQWCYHSYCFLNHLRGCMYSRRGCSSWDSDWMRSRRIASGLYRPSRLTWKNEKASIIGSGKDLEGTEKGGRQNLSCRWDEQCLSRTDWSPKPSLSSPAFFVMISDFLFTYFWHLARSKKHNVYTFIYKGILHYGRACLS